MMDDETREEVTKLIQEEIEDRLNIGIGQHQIPHQTIKERHIDWEELSASLLSSMKQAVLNTVNWGGRISGSTTLADGGEWKVISSVYYSTSANTLLHGIWHFNFYQDDSTVTTNIIPTGTSVAAANYRWYGQTDYAFSNLSLPAGESANGRTKFLSYLKNQSGVSKTVAKESGVRFIGQVV